MKKYLLLLFVIILLVVTGCGNRTSAIQQAEVQTSAEEPATPPAGDNDHFWKCIYMGVKAESKASQIDNEIIFDKEDDWLNFAYMNIPTSVAELIDEKMDWENQGIVVLQGYGAKGYFDFLAPVKAVRIEYGKLIVDYENNTDTENTFYAMNDMDAFIRRIYMISLDRSELEKLTD